MKSSQYRDNYSLGSKGMTIGQAVYRWVHFENLLQSLRHLIHLLMNNFNLTREFAKSCLSFFTHTSLISLVSTLCVGGSGVGLLKVNNNW